MVAEAMARAAHEADHLPLADVRSRARQESPLVRVAGRDAAAVVDAGVVAVTARRRFRLRERHRARRRRADRGAAADRDVDARVQPAPAHPEARHDRSVDRPDEVAGALADRTGSRYADREACTCFAWRACRFPSRSLRAGTIPPSTPPLEVRPDPRAFCPLPIPPLAAA